MKPGRCLWRIDRIKSVEREYQVAVIAKGELIATLRRDPATLTDQNLNQPDFDAFRDNLEATYLMRIFAEFESGLRDFWANGLEKTTSPKAYPLVESIRSKRSISFEDAPNVHLVRRVRNRFIHEGEREEDAEGAVIEVSIRDARKYLCKYFGRLPENW